MQLHTPAKIRRYRGGKRRLGFSLVEIMIVMCIFSIISAGLTRGYILSYKFSQSNITKNLAYTTVQGYMEQIKSLSVNELRAIIEDPTIPLPIIKLGNTNGLSSEQDESLFVKKWNRTTLILEVPDEEGKGNQVEVALRIRPQLYDLEASRYRNHAIPAIGISLKFKYQVGFKGKKQNKVAFANGELRSITGEGEI